MKYFKLLWIFEKIFNVIKQALIIIFPKYYILIFNIFVFVPIFNYIIFFIYFYAKFIPIFVPVSTREIPTPFDVISE